jgi:hypothetical protein
MAEAQVRNELPISLQIGLPEVLQKPTPPSHHLQETATAMMILLMSVEVLPEVIDPSCQKGNLNRCATPVIFVELVFLDDFLTIDGHPCRASARVETAGEAPPRSVSVQLSAWKGIKTPAVPQP